MRLRFAAQRWGAEARACLACPCAGELQEPSKRVIHKVIAEQVEQVASQVASPLMWCLTSLYT
jgi:hypothetical protein